MNQRNIRFIKEDYVILTVVKNICSFVTRFLFLK